VVSASCYRRTQPLRMACSRYHRPREIPMHQLHQHLIPTQRRLLIQTHHRLRTRMRLKTSTMTMDRNV